MMNNNSNSRYYNNSSNNGNKRRDNLNQFDVLLNNNNNNEFDSFQPHSSNNSSGMSQFNIGQHQASSSSSFYSPLSIGGNSSQSSNILSPLMMQQQQQQHQQQQQQQQQYGSGNSLKLSNSNPGSSSSSLSITPLTMGSPISSGSTSSTGNRLHTLSPPYRFPSSLILPPISSPSHSHHQLSSLGGNSGSGGGSSVAMAMSMNSSTNSNSSNNGSSNIGSPSQQLRQQQIHLIQQQQQLYSYDFNSTSDTSLGSSFLEPRSPASQMNASPIHFNDPPPFKIPLQLPQINSPSQTSTSPDYHHSHNHSHSHHGHSHSHTQHNHSNNHNNNNHHQQQQQPIHYIYNNGNSNNKASPTRHTYYPQINQQTQQQSHESHNSSTFHPNVYLSPPSSSSSANNSNSSNHVINLNQISPQNSYLYNQTSPPNSTSSTNNNTPVTRPKQQSNDTTTLWLDNINNNNNHNNTNIGNQHNNGNNQNNKTSNNNNNGNISNNNIDSVLNFVDITNYFSNKQNINQFTPNSSITNGGSSVSTPIATTPNSGRKKQNVNGNGRNVSTPPIKASNSIGSMSTAGMGSLQRSNNLYNTYFDVNQLANMPSEYTDQEYPEIKGRFRILEKIGQGTFSGVYKSVCIQGPDKGLVVALKRVAPTSSPTRILNEITSLLRVGGSSYVSKLMGAMRYLDQVTLILPYFEHDSFKDYFFKLTPNELRHYLFALFTALEHVHSHNICHRDVKPTNFLYNQQKNLFMLIDFGLAQEMPPETDEKKKRPREDARSKSKANEPKQQAPRAGTRGFRAPEVLLKYNKQTTSIDIWSVGVILMCVLSGRYPFFISPDDITSLAEIVSVIGTKKITELAHMLDKQIILSENIEPTSWKSLAHRLRDESGQVKETMPPEAYDLLERCLDPNPFTRITAKAALSHPFLQSIQIHPLGQ